MDGATSCSWVFVCEYRNVHCYGIHPTSWGISAKHATVFHNIDVT